MACDVSHRHRGVDGWLAAKVQTQLGILAVPVEQRALDHLGLARPCVCFDRSAALPRVPEHPRRDEEHLLKKRETICANPVIANRQEGVLAMWIGAIRLVVETKDAPNAGTDSLVQATVIRDGNDLRVLNLDYPTEDDLERGAIRNYDYIGPTRLPRRNDQTPELPPGIGQTPMPYPGYGFEFSHGLNGHLVMRLRINGDDMWIKDNVDLYVRFIRQKATSFDTLAWIEDSDWSYIASWGRDVAMSTDGSEGVTTWNLLLN